MPSKKRQLNPVWEKWKELCDKQEALIKQTKETPTIQGENWIKGQCKYYQTQLDKLKENEPDKYVTA